MTNDEGQKRRIEEEKEDEEKGYHEKDEEVATIGRENEMKDLFANQREL